MMTKKTEYVKYYLAGAVSLLTLAVYLPSLQNSFVEWDDNLYVYENPDIRSFDLRFFKWAFSSFYASNWHPLTWISHALDYAVWGLNPMGHHLTNNILHAINTFLVVLLVVKLMEIGSNSSNSSNSSSGSSGSSGSNKSVLIAAATTGLLFGLHPLHVESVAWVAERKDLLCALFFLLSIMMYIQYITPPSPSYLKRGWRSRGSYLLSLLFFSLALMSKPMAVSLPAVLFILDWYPLERIRSLRTFLSVSAEKVPFVALVLISSALTLLAQKAGGAMTLTMFVPFSTRILVAARSLIVYIWKMILPLNLIPYYPYPKDMHILSLWHLFPVVIATGITIICLGIARKHKLWLSVWSYYVATLIPVLGIIQAGGQSMADRYTYLPSLGPFLIAGLMAAWGSGKTDTLKRWGMPVKSLSAAAALFMFVPIIYLTSAQIGIWKNDIDLWSYVIEKEPSQNTVAYQNRGIAFAKAGNPDRAIADYTKVITLEPFAHFEAYYNRGYAYYSIGQMDRALEDFSTTIVLNPNGAGAYFNRAIIVQLMTGNKDLAFSDFQKACDLGDTKGCNALRNFN